MLSRLKAAALLLCLIASLTSAQIYKYVDKDGNVHFTDKQPDADKNAAEIEVEVHNTHDNPEMDAYRDYMRRDAQATKEEQQQQRKQLAEQKETRQKKRQACQQARRQLASYQQANVLYTLDKKGEKQYYSDEQRDERIARLQKLINKNC